MRTTLKYNPIATDISYSELDIEDMGNVCLEAIDSVDRRYYLMVKTKLGQTKVLEFGPIWYDSEKLDTETDWSYQEIEFSENAISKVLNTFLRNRKFIGKKKVSITELKTISEDYFMSCNIDPFKEMKEY